MIPHICDLNPIDFLYWIKQINDGKVTYTQKLDGSMNLSITKVNYKLVFSRFAKGQKKEYTLDNIPHTPIYNPLISAINFLTHSHVYNRLLNIMDNNDILDLEVLFGSQPNTIPYYNDGNFIAILRHISADGNNKNIIDIYKQINDIVIYNKDILYEYVFVDNIIKEFTTNNSWAFMIPEVCNNQINIQGKLSVYIKRCEEILNEVNPNVNKTNKNIYLLPLNKGKVDVRNIYKLIKLSINNQFSCIKNKIESFLCDNILNTISFEFGEMFQEGLVLTDNDTKQMVKLIDKNVFTKQNKHNWFYIELADDGVKINNEFHKGIISSFFYDLSKVFEIPSMVQYKKFVRSNIVSKSFIINSKIKYKLLKQAYNYNVQLMCLYNLVTQDNMVSSSFIKRTHDSIGLINNKFRAYTQYLEDHSHISSHAFMDILKLLFTDIYSYIK